MRIELKHGGWVELLDGWLSPSAAKTLRSELEAELSWQQRNIKLFGRSVVQPRLVAWCGDLPYRYSGETLPARSWPASCARLRCMVEAQLGEVLARPQASDAVCPGDGPDSTVNHALGNLYRCGADSMGFHADNEPELGTNPTVSSVSLGAPRRFILKPKGQAGEAKLELELRDGGLLIMGGSLQHHYVHGVPKQLGVREPRINVTFRRLLRAPIDKHLARQAL